MLYYDIMSNIKKYKDKNNKYFLLSGLCCYSST